MVGCPGFLLKNFMLKRILLVSVSGIIIVIAIVTLVVQKSENEVSGSAVAPSFASRGLSADSSVEEKGVVYNSPATYESDQKVGREAVVTDSAIPDQRMVVKTGQISLVVKDVNGALKNIGEFSVSQGGLVVESNSYQYNQAPMGVITVRVPAAKFDEARNAIKKLGELQSDSSNGTDITEEFIDVSARLKNLQATETQLLTIMKKAAAISDILAVQTELTRVRSEIEVLAGRQKYMQQNSDLSTLTVNLSTDPRSLPVIEKDTDSWKPSAVFKDALRSLILVGKGFVNGLIWIVVYIPLVLVAGGILWLVWRSIVKHELHDRS